MKRITVALVVLAGLLTTGAQAAPRHHHRFPHHPECQRLECAQHADHLWAEHHRPAPDVGPHQALTFTHYSGPCDGQNTVFADGHSIYDPRIDKHVIASASAIPMHAIVRFDRPVYGSRVWTVRDSGGYADLYRPDCNYGPGWPGDANPRIGFRIIGHASG